MLLQQKLLRVILKHIFPLNEHLRGDLQRQMEQQSRKGTDVQV